MALRGYENYLHKVAQTPSEAYLGLTQATINKQWENTTQSYTILQQDSIGSLMYHDVDISVDMAVDLATGVKKSDDFKTFSHRDLTTKLTLGIMYQYENNYWLTTSTDDIGSPINSCTVRRCNNYLKWINPNNGAIISYPCVVDYEAASPSEQIRKTIITPNNHYVVMVQGNEDTLGLTVNQRFIINGRPWKLTGYNNAMQLNAVTPETTLLYYDMYLDEKQPSDDYVNGIANANEYLYSINIIQDITEQVNGFSGSLSANVMLNGEIVERNVVWSSNEYATVVGGVYTLNGTVGNVANIKASIEGNPEIYDEVDIEIVDIVADNYEIVVNPLYGEIRQGQTVSFRADLYNNGVVQVDEVNASAIGVDTKCYAFGIANNMCTLQCKQFSVEPLQITFTSGEVTKTIIVQLKSLF